MQFTDPVQHSSGYYIVAWRQNFLHWLAWRDWQHLAFKKIFFPENLTTLTGWPPVDDEGAKQFATYLAGIRKTATEESSREKTRHTGRVLSHVHPNPVPWDAWTTAHRIEIMEEERNRRIVTRGGQMFTYAPRYVWHPRYGKSIVYERPAVTPAQQDELRGLIA